MTGESHALVLSATGLRAWDRCERLFAFTYIHPMPWPGPQGTDPQLSERRTSLGTQLHHLIHQHALGLDPRSLARTDPDLRRWFERYRASAYAALDGPVHSELHLSASVGDMVVRATFDRVIQRGSEFVIVDWKTSERLPDARVLADDWQALLYPFVLAEVGSALNGGVAIAPEAIKMVFYYVEHGQEVVIQHDSERHEGVRSNLLRVMASMARSGYEPTGKQGQRCLKPAPCRFYSLCHLADMRIEEQVADDDVPEVGPDDYLALLPEYEFDDEPVSL